MIKFEYETVTVKVADAIMMKKALEKTSKNLQEILQKKGKEGWELGSVVPIIQVGGGFGNTDTLLVIFQRKI